MMTFVTTQPVRLRAALARQLPLPAWRVKALLQEGQVKVDGRRTRQDVPLSAGVQVDVYLRPQDLPKPAVLYADDRVVVVEKPPGQEVAGQGMTTTALLRLSGYPTARPCHRLDVWTGGLVLFALDDEAEQAALDLFYHRALDKRYVARCVGKPVPPGVYEAYLYKDAQAARVYILERPRPGAAPIRTGIDVLEDGPYPLLELALLTGRTHQLRAHLAHLGLPILGDDKYGDRSANKSAGLRHPCLWAVSLAFPEGLPSPLTGLAGRRLVSAPRFPNR